MTQTISLREGLPLLEQQYRQQVAELESCRTQLRQLPPPRISGIYIEDGTWSREKRLKEGMPIPIPPQIKEQEGRAQRLQARIAALETNLHSLEDQIGQIVKILEEEGE